MDKGKKLLSIDSSTASTGFGVFVDNKYKYSGLIKPKQKDSNNRYYEMVESLEHLLNTEDPDIVIVERMHQIRNVDAFRKLCKILGGIEKWCIINDRDYIELSPAQWRSYAKDDEEKVPRKRAELKQWAVEKVKEIYKEKVFEDSAEAILIGYGYINNGTKEN